MNARHLQHADAIAHRRKVVRIWVLVWPRPAGLPAPRPLPATLGLGKGSLSCLYQRFHVYRARLNRNPARRSL